jgi:Ca2+-binding RTX toxin-like protein
MLPTSEDPTKKTLFQRIKGSVKYNSNGIDWKNSAIKGVIQYNIFSNLQRPETQWRASSFRLTGGDIAKIVREYTQWYSTPDNYDKYKIALDKTQKLVEAILFSGDDKIIGSNERDVLIGGNGNDSIAGRGGGDILTGGKGSDRFVYRSTRDSAIAKSGLGISETAGEVDVITDFNGKKGDKIDLRKLKIGKGKSLTYIGDSPFSGNAGEVRFALGNLQVDTGDKDFLMNITLSKVTSFSKDFLLL